MKASTSCPAISGWAVCPVNVDIVGLGRANPVEVNDSWACVWSAVGCRFR